MGLANNQNPVVIVVPCHRVIGADGKLVGYSGGLPRKKSLLGLESRYRDMLPLEGDRVIVPVAVSRPAANTRPAPRARRAIKPVKPSRASAVGVHAMAKPVARPVKPLVVAKGATKSAARPAMIARAPAGKRAAAATTRKRVR